MTSAESVDQSETYDMAERYIRLGISVIPIEPGSKEPPTGFKWGEFAGRLADASERYQWFAVERKQLAVVPGTASGNLVPLDFDGPGGFDSLAERYPIIRTFPRLRTGSGKHHVWVRTRRPTRKYVCHAPDGSNLEVRAGVHYTLAPPSIHPNGEPYIWEVEPWDGIPVIDLEDIGLTTIDRQEQEPGEPFEEGDPLSERDRLHIVDLLEAHYVPYSRHELCLAVSGWLAGHGVPEDDSRWIVRTLAERAGDENRVREYLRGIRDTYAKARAGIATAGWSRLVNRDDPLISPATAKSLDLLLRYRNPVFTFASETEAPGHPWIIDVADLLTEADEPDIWQVEGVLRHPTVSLIVGPPKSYKSLLAQELCIAVATGTPMFGLFSVPEPRCVIYIQEESSRRAVRGRFRTILTGRAMAPGVVRGMLHTITNQNFELDNPEQIKRLVSDGIERYGAELVIIDPLAEVHSADENAQKEMRPIMRALKQIRDLYQVSVIVVHHNNKSKEYTNPADMIRGSSSIWAAMDGGIFVLDAERDDEKRVRIVLKEGSQASPFLYRPVFDGAGVTFDIYDLEGKQRRTLSDQDIIGALVAMPGWNTATVIGRRLGFSLKTIQARLNAMAARGQIRKRASGRAHVLLYASLGTDDDAPDF